MLFQAPNQQHMSQLRLRRYRREDRAACVSLFEGNIPGSFLPHEIPVFVEFLDTFTGAYLVVEEAGSVLACGGLAEHADHVTLCWGMVARERQRQGIGRLLLQARLGLAGCSPGVRRIHMNTSQRSAPFFAKEGFQTRRVTLHSYAPGLHRHDMELLVGPATRNKLSLYLVGLQEAGYPLRKS
jgi:GNAT superfamily N-acetyltransferase